MLEAFEYKGRWWLPENPRKKISGILTYTPGKNISLELIGAFVKSPPFIRHMLQPEIILGISDNGKRITLYKTLETHYAGAAKSGFVAKTAFYGKHYSQPSDIQFHSLSVNFTYLEEWLFTRPFEIKYEKTDISAKYMLPEIYKVEISPLNSTLSFDYCFEGGGDEIRNVQWEQTAFFNIKPKEEKKIEWFNKVLFELQTFLSLVVGSPVYPKIVKANGNQMRHADKRHLEESVEIYTLLPYIPDVGKIFLKDVLFNFPFLKENFRGYLDNWFQKAEVLNPVYELFFAILYTKSMHLEQQFLILTQAIESFHRRIYGGNYLSGKKYKTVSKTLKAAIPKCLPGDFKESMKNRLEYGNEFSLRKRLKELLNITWGCMKHYITGKDSFISDIVNTRNYLTHYDKKLKNKALKGKDLFRFVERLRLFLIVLLLNQIGILPIEAHEKIKYNRNFVHLISRNDG